MRHFRWIALFLPMVALFVAPQTHAAVINVTVDVPDTCVPVASPSFMNVHIDVAGQALPDDTVRIDVLINGSGGFPYSVVADVSGTFVFHTQVGITQAGEYTVQVSAAVDNQAPVLSNTITVKVVTNTAQCTMRSIYLPYVQMSRPELITALATTPIASRPVTVRGEVFFTGNVAVPAMLPEGGQFYLSASATSGVPGLVDDQLILRAGSTVIFSYDYRRDARPTAQLVPIPRSVLAPYAGQTLTIVFADKYGGQVSATPLYLLWER